MPLFPTRRYAMASSAPAPMETATDQYDPLRQGQRRRQGLFGRVGAWLGSRDWEGIGAAMREDPGILSGLRDDRMRRSMFGEKIRERKIEEDATHQDQSNIDAAIGTLDPSMQPWARIAPDAAARAAFERPDEPDWQTDAAGRPYTIGPNGQVRFGEGRVAVPPRGSGGVQIQMPQTAITRLAEQYVTTGVLPPGISRNPRLAAQVYAEADAIAAAQGLTPQEQAWRGANYAANNQGLRALQRQRTLVQSFERTALANLQLVQRLSRAVPRSDYPLVNQAIMTGQRQTGNTAVAQYVNALIGARTEYAKVLSGATGAAGLTDSARVEAEEMFSTYATPDQIDALIEVAQMEMHNRLVAFDEQEAYLREQMTGRGEAPHETPLPDIRGRHSGRGGSSRGGANRPEEVSPREWDAMTPEEQALWD